MRRNFVWGIVVSGGVAVLAAAAAVILVPTFGLALAVPFFIVGLIGVVAALGFAVLAALATGAETPPSADDEPTAEPQEAEAAD